MRQLNSITIAPDGQTATIGGGVLTKEITDALWSAQKQTVTGWCECTGAVAPLLGGGHGLLQGQYGLLADNLVSARLVLANGTAVTASSTSRPDLFWAIRGAGHNFGVVTEFEYRIYDVPSDDSWSYSMFIFTGDKVKAVFEQMNKTTQDENEVAEIINYSLFAWNPAIDSHGPVHIFFILYHGPASEEEKYSAPFQAIGAAVTQTGTTTYPELPALVGNGNNDLACGHGYSILRFPIKMKTYNIQAQRAVYDRFTQITTQIPELNNSFFLFEGYSVKRVKAVPEESTAFAHRQDNLLIAPVMLYSPNSTLDVTAIKAGKELRRILHDADESSELYAHVNYAHGDETLEEVYGFEELRQQHLKVLKAEYDPSGMFNYYVPIY